MKSKSTIPNSFLKYGGYSSSKYVNSLFNVSLPLSLSLSLSLFLSLLCGLNSRL
jgi:hypothetical protein